VRPQRSQTKGFKGNLLKRSILIENERTLGCMQNAKCASSEYAHDRTQSGMVCPHCFVPSYLIALVGPHGAWLLGQPLFERGTGMSPLWTGANWGLLFFSSFWGVAYFGCALSLAGDVEFCCCLRFVDVCNCAVATSLGHSRKVLRGARRRQRKVFLAIGITPSPVFTRPV
jgi:hypothetical protein